jgi:SAM-dependent methyltransferase
MDLHDFEDVAANYDWYIPALGLNTAGFEDFHLSLAAEYGSQGILDIACGTGALTVPLAAAGFDVTALDLSEPMLSVLREKLRCNDLDIQLIQANMTDFEAGRKFSLAIIARSGFMHLLTPDEQRRALLTIRSHLTEGGVLTLNTFQPYPPLQAQQMNASPEDYFLRAEYVNALGQKERIYNVFCYDYMTQVMRGSWKFETLDNHGRVAETRIRPLAMRHTNRQEMAYLFELCGYDILAVYGDYERNPTKGNFIWVVRRKTSL